MYLYIVSIGELLYKRIPVGLMFCHIVSEWGYHCFVESSSLAVCLLVILPCRGVFATKKAA